MVQKIFTEAVDTNFSNPDNWNPAGVPKPGDQAALLMVYAVAGGVLPAAITIDLVTFGANGQGAELLLQNATVPASTIITESTNWTYAGPSGPSSLRFSGAVVNQGTLTLEGYAQTVPLPSGTTLTNDGTINVFASSPQFTAADTSVSIVNNGLIRVINPADSRLYAYPDKQNTPPQVALLGPAISGTGALTVSVNSGLELGGPVGNGQSLRFVGGSNAMSTVQIDQPSAFAATIGGFVSGDMLTLATTAATSISYVPASAGSGTLQIFDGGSAAVASLQFSGVYTTANFSVSESGSSLVLTTNVTDPSTGSTTTPTSSGLFRFFDTTDGTHFYTANVAERDAVLAGRPDLVEETNDFGAVTTAVNGTTESVYRFFDTTHGTHFFTASAAERDQVIATRSDLTYEPASTFLEDATPQTGDVPVYRLFSKLDGTHLYTGSAGELAALTTPGGTGYRADLVAEGVTFYAPSGSYT